MDETEIRKKILRYQTALGNLAVASDKLRNAEVQANYVRNHEDEQWRRNAVRMHMDEAERLMQSAERIAEDLIVDMQELKRGCGQAGYVAAYGAEDWRCNVVSLSARSSQKGIGGLSASLHREIKKLEDMLSTES